MVFICEKITPAILKFTDSNGVNFKGASSKHKGSREKKDRRMNKSYIKKKVAESRRDEAEGLQNRWILCSS